MSNLCSKKAMELLSENNKTFSVINLILATDEKMQELKSWFRTLLDKYTQLKKKRMMKLCNQSTLKNN